jgi:glycosyltransferase involved in cell wall biosynthesis
MNLLCYIHSLASGGAERVLAKLADHWSQQGHSVTLVTNTPTDADTYPVDAKVARHSLNSPEPSKTIVHAARNTWQRKRRLQKLLEQLHIDCVVAFMPIANYISLAASQKLAIPTIISERVHPEFLGLSAARWHLAKRRYPSARQLVVLSELSARWFRDHTSVSRISVIPNSISLPLQNSGGADINPDDHIPSDRRLVLSVGRLVEQKQPERVLEAYAQVIGQNSSWHLGMLGDGPESASLRALCNSLGIAEHTTFLPHAGNLQSWYERADIFVSASKFEGSPNALLEAMACGCAVAAFDCLTGPGDIIRDRQNGLLIPLNDHARFASALELLVNDESLRHRLAEAASQVVNTFSDAAFYAAWDRVIEQSAGLQS